MLEEHRQEVTHLLLDTRLIDPRQLLPAALRRPAVAALRVPTRDDCTALPAPLSSRETVASSALGSPLPHRSPALLLTLPTPSLPPSPL